MLEKLVVEQLMNTMPTELRVWVAERKPQSGEQAGRLADDYLQARRHVSQGSNERKDRNKGGTSAPSKCFRCGSADHIKQDCPNKEESGGAGTPTKTARTKAGSLVKCYNCGKYGHILSREGKLFCKGWLGKGSGQGRASGGTGSIRHTVGHRLHPNHGQE